MSTTELLAQIEKEEASAAGLTISEYRKRLAYGEMEKEKKRMEHEKLSRRLARREKLKECLTKSYIFQRLEDDLVMSCNAYEDKGRITIDYIL